MATTNGANPASAAGVDEAWLAEVRAALVERVLPRVADYDSEGSMPADVLNVLTDLGAWAPFVPTEFGGRACTDATLGRLHEVVGAVCTSLRSILTAHVMVTFAVLKYGTEKQKSSWLPQLTGGQLAAFCLTGSRSGSTADISETTADPDGCGGWTITGHKKWTTSAQRAGMFLIFCRAPDGAMLPLLVPRGAAGLRCRRAHAMLGARSNLLGEVILDHVHVDQDALLGPQGWPTSPVMADCLLLGRFSVASGETGLIEECLRLSLGYAQSRTVPVDRGGTVVMERLNQQPQIQAALSRMTAAAKIARLLVDDLTPDRQEKVLDSWLAKWVISEQASAVAADAVHLQGALGCTEANPVSRAYRDTALHRVIEGTDELMQRVIWEHGWRLGARR